MKRGSSPAGEEAGDRDAPTLSVILPGVNEILSSAPLLRPHPPPLPDSCPVFDLLGAARVRCGTPPTPSLLTDPPRSSTSSKCTMRCPGFPSQSATCSSRTSAESALSSSAVMTAPRMAPSPSSRRVLLHVHAAPSTHNTSTVHDRWKSIDLIMELSTARLTRCRRPAHSRNFPLLWARARRLRQSGVGKRIHRRLALPQQKQPRQKQGAKPAPRPPTPHLSRRCELPRTRTIPRLPGRRHRRRRVR